MVRMSPQMATTKPAPAEQANLAHMDLMTGRRAETVRVGREAVLGLGHAHRQAAEPGPLPADELVPDRRVGGDANRRGRCAWRRSRSCSTGTRASGYSGANSAAADHRPWPRPCAPGPRRRRRPPPSDGRARSQRPGARRRLAPRRSRRGCPATNALMAMIAGTPNWRTFSTWRSRFAQPRRRASMSSRARSALATPPFIFSERMVATTTAAPASAPPAGT